MTPEEIKKIAYYISERRHKEEEVSDSTTFIFLIDIYADIVTKISERYCIVEKSKVLAEYDFNHSAAIGEAIRTGDMANKYILKRDLLESIFGKDTFEEEGK